MSVKQEAEGASGDEAKRFRSLQFWSRAGSIWAGYKLAQAQAQWLRVRGHSEEHIKETHWAPHADRAGQDMHALCVDMRGFFIKVHLLRPHMYNVQPSSQMYAAELLWPVRARRFQAASAQGFAPPCARHTTLGVH